MRSDINNRNRRLLLLPWLLLSVSACHRQNHNVHSAGPDNLPMRLQLPKSGSAESMRIVQYGDNDAIRQSQQSLMNDGPYEGGRQVRLYRDDNSLKEISIYYKSDDGKDPQLGYHADLDGTGAYVSEVTNSESGVRENEGHRLADRTFEQNSFFQDGIGVYKHAVYGQVMVTAPKLAWKPFSFEVFRRNRTVIAVYQLRDDGTTETRFFDEHHCLSEALYSDKSNTQTEVDFRKDCKTPLVRSEFGYPKKVWNFDEGGKLLDQHQWWNDGSYQVTVYDGLIPLYTQYWDVDHARSKSLPTGERPILYLSWTKEYFADGTTSKEIHFFPGTTTVHTIDVYEAPPQDAKLKPPADLPSFGSTTPAKNWEPPAPTPAPAPTPTPAVASAATAGATPSVASTVAGAAPVAIAPPVVLWSPSGAHATLTYSESGNLQKVDHYEAGKSDVAQTDKHAESEHITAQINPKLLKPLTAGEPPNKPKDPTPDPPSWTAHDEEDF